MGECQHEIFQWLTEEQSRKVVDDPEILQHVGEEIADVLIYPVRLASVRGVDLNAVTSRKLEINRQNYPATK
jgi:dCTP diphosphatase